jgi:tRNA A-37 threonylcarbamoyl transferase component Bud32
LYDSIACSRSLIYLDGCIKTTKERITLILEPVGDPIARLGDLMDLENATHDMLHGLADLHKAGYTHRDLTWNLLGPTKKNGKVMV